jgi:hypothetical protein
VRKVNDDKHNAEWKTSGSVLVGINGIVAKKTEHARRDEQPGQNRQGEANRVPRGEARSAAIAASHRFVRDITSAGLNPADVAISHAFAEWSEGCRDLLDLNGSAT